MTLKTQAALLIAAAVAPLPPLIQAGRFRQDLYDRLRGFPFICRR